ncbi:MAG: hypothetical protein F4X98_16910 [Gammaproteobacteria bacterium]|nr:hypothetical protein [Gammaproteobacteria bacterium]
MQTTVIDTLRYANSLKEAGVEPSQAEAMSRAINDELTEGVATKRDLDDAVVELKGEIAKLDSRFDAMEARSDAKFEGIDAKFGAIDAKFGGIDRKFEGMIQAMESKFLGELRTLDAKFEASIEALNSKIGAVGRYVFLVLALVVGLGLYNAATPHLVKPASAPAAQASSSPE